LEETEKGIELKPLKKCTEKGREELGVMEETKVLMGGGGGFHGGHWFFPVMVVGVLEWGRRRGRRGGED